MEKSNEKNIRPDNLLKNTGIDYPGLTEEERVMQRALLEEYKKKGKSFLGEVKIWREKNIGATLNEAIRALYKIEEET